MLEATKTEASTTGFAPHVEELHELFRSRGVRFGEPGDLAPFLERLSKDESFRDEMGSMVRAIIYRERDGLTPVELLELLVMAVAGMPAEDAPESVRNGVRQMMGFIGGVFRSRWNPGGSAPRIEEENSLKTDAKASVSPGGERARVPEPETEPAKNTAPEPAARPVTPIFYQAQVVANGGREPEGVLPLRGSTGAAAQAASAVTTEEGTAAPPVAAFLRGEGTTAVPALEAEQRRSRGWVWVVFVVAVVIAFCAGMYARQWMLTRGMAWPWHGTAASVGQVAAPAAESERPAQVENGSASVLPGQPATHRRAAQVQAARSEWTGATESASDLGTPKDNAPKDEAAAMGADSAVPDPGASSAADSSGGATSQPSASAAKPSPEVRAKVARAGRVAAMVGASPALMASHLVFAPEPEYPELARLAHLQGPVVVEALVGRNGSVVRAHAISGHRLLRAAAEEAVYERRYRPYVVNDIPMAVRTLVTVDFRLR